MPLKPSDRVHHRKLRRDGVVTEVLKSGRFRVAFGSVVVECGQDDLAPPKNTRDEDDDDFEPKAKSKKQSGGSRGGGMASVDLHGMRVEEAIALVQSRVNDALMSGASGIHIIHGLGTGNLKAAVHRYLAGLSVVKRFRLDEKNHGTTVAYF